MDHLKGTIPDGYSWDDFMSGELHIDHIYPISRFNITSVDCDDFKECWSLSNLQLLARLDNISKGNRVYEEDAG